jgi:hypothetical protein
LVAFFILGVNDLKKVLLLIFFGFLLSNDVWSLTLSEIQTAIRRNIRDTATDSSLYRHSDAELLSYINAGQREVAERTWCVEQGSNFDIDSGDNTYDLSTTLIHLAHAYIIEDATQNTYELEYKSRNKMFEDNSAWNVDTGTPTAYWIRTDSNVGTRTQIVLSPVPNTYNFNLGVHYYYRPSDLSSSSDIPFDGALHLYPYHDVLVYYGTKMVLMSEGNQPMADWYGNLYEARVDGMADRFGRVTIETKGPKLAPPDKK